MSVRFIKTRPGKHCHLHFYSVTQKTYRVETRVKTKIIEYARDNILNKYSVHIRNLKYMISYYSISQCVLFLLLPLLLVEWLCVCIKSRPKVIKCN